MLNFMISYIQSGAQQVADFALVPLAYILAAAATMLVGFGLITATDGRLVLKWLSIGVGANAMFVVASGMYTLGSSPSISPEQFAERIKWLAFAPVAVTSTVVVAFLLIALIERLTDDTKPSVLTIVWNATFGDPQPSGTTPGNGMIDLGVTTTPAFAA